MSLQEAKKNVLHGENPLFERPLIRERGARYLLVDEALLVPAIKQNLESLLKMRSEYPRLRGETLESLVYEEFRNYFPQAQLYRNLKYSLKEGHRGEADLLVLVGGIALIVEVKAATIFKGGTEMSSVQFSRRIRQNISKASEQVEQLRAFVELEERVPLEKGKPLRLEGVKEIHTVIVTLEELLDLSSSQTDLVDAGLISGDKQLPWLVSLNDLQLIFELAVDPAEFLLYLRRRRDPLIAAKYRTTDELDLFLAFRHNGLWAEDVEDASVPAYVESMTGELDQWVHGVVADKPQIKNTPLLAYTRQLAQLGFDHWLEFGATLLSLSEDAQEDTQEKINKILSLARADYQMHNCLFLIEDEGPTRYKTLVVFAVKGKVGTTKEIVRNLMSFLKMKKTQTAASRGFLCILDENGKIIDLKYEGREFTQSDFPPEEFSKLIPYDIGE